MVQSYHEEFLNDRTAVNWLMGLDDPIPSSNWSCPSLIEHTWPCHPAGTRYLTFVLPNEGAMPTKKKLTTTVSTKGQVILPKAIREQRHWPAGTELVVEDTPEGVLLKAMPAFAPTKPKDVFGSLPYKGPAKSIVDMDAGIAAEAKRRHARNRY
jgi:AbrB family looped-hinge helix DNA binding protein